MINKKLIVVLYGALFALLCSCSSSPDNSNSKRFDYNLRGTWETPEEINGIPSGKPGDSLYAKIVIDYNNITITGIIAHFEGFTRGIALEAYSEDSLIYIYDKGEWQMQNPIPYRIWEAGSYYQKTKMLTLKNNGSDLKDETFRLTGEYGYTSLLCF